MPCNVSCERRRRAVRPRLLAAPVRDLPDVARRMFSKDVLGRWNLLAVDDVPLDLSDALDARGLDGAPCDLGS
jgi:hypothetical protein